MFSFPFDKIAKTGSPLESNGLLTDCVVCSWYSRVKPASITTFVQCCARRYYSTPFGETHCGSSPVLLLIRRRPLVLH